MASIRARVRKDGSAAYAVLYRDAAGQQCSQTFDEHAAAERFRSLVDSVGAARALEVAGFGQGASRGKPVPTVAEWARHHLDHLTGVEPYTIRQYEGYLRNDIAPTALGALPLNAVSTEDVALWVKAMQEAKSSGKTIRNKHGFVASVFKSALKKHVSENPCEGTRLPRWDRQEMVFLTAAEFGLLYAQIPVFWRPMARFLVSSGDAVQRGDRVDAG